MAAVGLRDCPDQILVRFCRSLSFKDLDCFRTVTRRVNYLLQDPTIWQHSVEASPGLNNCPYGQHTPRWLAAICPEVVATTVTHGPCYPSRIRANSIILDSALPGARRKPQLLKLTRACVGRADPDEWRISHQLAGMYTSKDTDLRITPGGLLLDSHGTTLAALHTTGINICAPQRRIPPLLARLTPSGAGSCHFFSDYIVVMGAKAPPQVIVVLVYEAPAYRKVYESAHAFVSRVATCEGCFGLYILQRGQPTLVVTRPASGAEWMTTTDTGDTHPPDGTSEVYAVNPPGMDIVARLRRDNVVGAMRLTLTWGTITHTQPLPVHPLYLPMNLYWHQDRQGLSFQMYSWLDPQDFVHCHLRL